MSSHIIATIFQRVQTSPSESIVLQVLCHAANVVGQNARLSYEVLAARSGFSVRWCIALVARLESRHLLRVHRTRLGYAHCAINRYDIVVPWRRDLTYQEPLEKRQAYLRAKEDTARLRTSERIVHGDITQRENLGEPPTEADVVRLGVNPDTPFGRALQGLAPP